MTGPRTADDTAPRLTPTVILRLRKLEATMRELGLLAENAPSLETCNRVVALVVSARAEDYAAGRDGSHLSGMMPAVKPVK